MVKNKIKYLMVDKNINSIVELIEITGVSRQTLTKLYHNKNVETIKLEMLFKICNSLNCVLSDLIEFIPDNEETQN